MMDDCPHCGMPHKAMCPKVKSIEYDPPGSTCVKRIEFHDPAAHMWPNFVPAVHPMPQPAHVPGWPGVVTYDHTTIKV